MAYAFAAASSQYLTTASSPISALPFTAFAHFYPNRLDSRENILSPNVNSSAQNTLSTLEFDGSQAGDPMQITFRDEQNTNIAQVKSTAAPTQSAWNTTMAVFAGSASRTIYLNGGNSATNTTSVAGTLQYNLISIGALFRSTASLYFDGRVAEAAFWSVALNADEMASLAKGFKPTRIRPQSLVFYAPLIRNLADRKGGLTITNNNTATVADHPRVY